MTLKENLKAKIKIDQLLQKLVSTNREVPSHRRVNNILARELLDMTDFKYEKVRDLHIYFRPFNGELLEVLVLDNELPIYHATVDDVAMRKSPYRNEMFKIGNIKKILFDKDVIISRGKESLKRLHAIALSRLNFTCTKEDLAELVEDARRGLELKSIDRIQKSFDLFFELLGIQALSVGELSSDLQIFARPKHNGHAEPAFEHLIFFDENQLALSLKKGDFSPQSDSDTAWVRRYSQGGESADLQGVDVFKFLSELSLERTSLDDNRTN